MKFKSEQVQRNLCMCVIEKRTSTKLKFKALFYSTAYVRVFDEQMNAIQSK